MRYLFLLASLALISAPLAAAPGDFAPALAAKGRTPSAVKLDEGRKPAEVLDFLGVKKGDQVLDFWGGSGYYTQILARFVGPEGRVTSFEPSQYYSPKSQSNWNSLKGIERNIEVFSRPMQNFRAPADSYDFVLIHLIYHDLYWVNEKEDYPRMDPDRILARLYEAVKPGGIVGVVDHVGPKADTRLVVEKLHRIDPATVKADFERAGFVLEAQSDVLRVPGDDLLKSVFDPAVRGKTDRFVMRFRKPA